jgi:hypothetical protein
MNEKLIAAIAIIISSLPTLGMGLACITRRWMPEQYSKSPNSARLQQILGLGLLCISTSLIAFGAVLNLLPMESLSWVTTMFVVVVNIEAITMVVLLHRALKKTS